MATRPSIRDLLSRVQLEIRRAEMKPEAARQWHETELLETLREVEAALEDVCNTTGA